MEAGKFQKGQQVRPLAPATNSKNNNKMKATKIEEKSVTITMGASELRMLSIGYYSMVTGYSDDIQEAIEQGRPDSVIEMYREFRDEKIEKTKEIEELIKWIEG